MGLGCCVVRQPQGVSACSLLEPSHAAPTDAGVIDRSNADLHLMIQRRFPRGSDASEVRRAFQAAAVGRWMERLE